MIDQEKRIEAAARAMEPSAFATYDRGYTTQNVLAEIAFLNAEKTIRLARRKAGRALAAADAVTAETRAARETPDDIAKRTVLGIPMLVDEAESMAKDILATVALARKRGHDHIAPFQFSRPPEIISRIAHMIETDRAPPVESQDRAAS